MGDLSENDATKPAYMKKKRDLDSQSEDGEGEGNAAKPVNT